MKKRGVGVVVGRFQVHELHEGHQALIREARKHDKLLICIGVRPAICTPHDPLDYPTREQMVKEVYKEAIVVPLPDNPSDAVWSKQLDGLISIMFPTDEVTMYQGRDSFQGRYLGGHKVVELDEIPHISGTDLRAHISRHVLNSPEFRHGVIYGATNQFSRIDPVVDICLYRKTEERGIEILVGQKAHEFDSYRLPGGHINAADESAERAARRELMEETGLEGGEFEILDCIRVTSRDAPGYAMFTTLFLASYVHGSETPGDDMARLFWFNLPTVRKSKFSDNHEQLLNIALDTLSEI